ncbi:MAG: dihydrofolate reductase [Pirellulaceae bacterium]|nr:dihydrofolate reductase [Pirellulaceae bacterium]
MSTETKLAVILAAAQNGVIGREQKLPWRLSRDLQRFKQLTMGAPLIMGRLTFQSLGRFLPGRQHLVISRQADVRGWWPVETPPEQGLVFPSFADAWDYGRRTNLRSVFAIGGHSIFEAALPLADTLYLTRVMADVAGDVWMPAIDWRQWECVERQFYTADERNEFDLAFEDYQRRVD